MSDLPNCPLCGAKLRVDPDDYTAGWLCSDEDCALPTCSLDALRTLSALRKPMTEQEADALLGPAMETLGARALAVVAEGMRLGRTLSKAELTALPGKAEATAAVQRIVYALTGKTKP